MKMKMMKPLAPQHHLAAAAATVASAASAPQQPTFRLLSATTPPLASLLALPMHSCSKDHDHSKGIPWSACAFMFTVEMRRERAMSERAIFSTTSSNILSNHFTNFWVVVENCGYRYMEIIELLDKRK